MFGLNKQIVNWLYGELLVEQIEISENHHHSYNIIKHQI